MVEDGGALPVFRSGPSGSSVVTMTVTPRDFEALVVTEEEFESVASGGNTLQVGFFGIAIGAAVSFGISLLTTTPTTPVWQWGTFVALFGLSLTLTAYFGMATYREWRQNKSRIQRILTRARRRA